MYTKINERLVEQLIESGLTLATAESCTGGLIATKIVDVPSASQVYIGGLITYSNRAKVKNLGVDEATVERYGAVSGQVATQMATGVREQMGTDIGLSTTGIAGPSGGTPEKPIGLVYIALANHDKIYCRKFIFAGDRQAVRAQSAHTALLILSLDLDNELNSFNFKDKSALFNERNDN